MIDNSPATRYRIEHWHFDDVTVLAESDDASATPYLAALLAAHASGTVVVVAENSDRVVAWYPLWPARGEPEPPRRDDRESRSGGSPYVQTLSEGE
jgi:hypothetical protein